MQMVQSAGGKIWKDDGTPDFVGNEILVKSLETYKELFDTGVMDTGNSWDEYIATFTSGKTLGTINGCWIIASVQADETQSGLWSLTNMPKLSGISSATNYSNQGGSTWVITSNCKNVELASDFFAKTFAGSNELYDTILPGCAAISCWTPAASSSVYSEPIEFFGGEKIYSKIADFGAKVPAFERGVYFTEANTAIATAATNIVNGADIDKELEAAEETVNFNMGN
jgi:lactose/L-arabinose transport system substrate-binding protein